MMNNAGRQEGLEQERGSISIALWIGLLLPPIVWAFQMQLNYWAIRGSCSRRSNISLYVVTIIALLAVVLSALNAWLVTRRNAPKKIEWGNIAFSSSFIFALGLLSAALFFIAIAAQGVATFILDPCQL